MTDDRQTLREQICAELLPLRNEIRDMTSGAVAAAARAEAIATRALLDVKEIRDDIAGERAFMREAIERFERDMEQRQVDMNIAFGDLRQAVGDRVVTALETHRPNSRERHWHYAVVILISLDIGVASWLLGAWLGAWHAPVF